MDVEHVRQILLALGRQRSLRDPLAGVCEELGFTPSQLHCVAWVGSEQALTMGEISRRLGITEKTITGVVDRLEASGHLKRERDVADRRVVRVHLTEAGLDVFHQIDSVVSTKLRRILGVLDADDRCSLLRILETLRERLGARSDSPVEESR